MVGEEFIMIILDTEFLFQFFVGTFTGFPIFYYLSTLLCDLIFAAEGISNLGFYCGVLGG